MPTLAYVLPKISRGQDVQSVGDRRKLSPLFQGIEWVITVEDWALIRRCRRSAGLCPSVVPGGADTGRCRQAPGPAGAGDGVLAFTVHHGADDPVPDDRGPAGRDVGSDRVPGRDSAAADVKRGRRSSPTRRWPVPLPDLLATSCTSRRRTSYAQLVGTPQHRTCCGPRCRPICARGPTQA